MTTDLAGKAAIVTGASRGIGRAVALALAHAGARVLLHGTSGALLGALADEIAATGGEALVLAGEVADPANGGTFIN